LLAAIYYFFRAKVLCNMLSYQNVRNALFMFVIITYLNRIVQVSGQEQALLDHRKIFSARGCLKDHFKILTQIPRIYGAYMGPNAIDPKTSEKIMLAVNSANKCPYCTELHGELSRMADVQERETIKQANSIKEVKKAVPNESVIFARIFGETSGRGERLQQAYESLKQSVGPQKAASVNALCWFLHWGSICGNTLNHFLFQTLQFKTKKGANVLFLALFSCYYSVCYILIKITSALFRFLPSSVPQFVSACIGIVLASVASLWIIPLGVIGGVLLPLLGKGPNTI